MSSNDFVALLKQGIAAASAGRKIEARGLLLRAVEANRDHEPAWQWLASVAQSQDEVRECMEEILRINPDNAAARKWIDQLEALTAAAAAAEKPPVEPAAKKSVTAAPAEKPEPVPEKPVPEKRALSTPVAAERDEAPVEEPAKPRESTERQILVVDDSPTIRHHLREILEEQGYHVVTAADGMEALSKITDLLPGLVLLDVTMPRVNGFQICEIVKANEATRNIPIILLSGRGGFSDKLSGRPLSEDCGSKESCIRNCLQH